MRKLLLTLTTLALAVPALSAAPVQDAALLKYARRSMMNCPGSNVTLETIPQAGPAGFTTYRATQTSTD